MPKQDIRNRLMSPIPKIGTLFGHEQTFIDFNKMKYIVVSRPCLLQKYTLLNNFVWQTLSHNVVSSTLHHEWDSN